LGRRVVLRHAHAGRREGDAGARREDGRLHEDEGRGHDAEALNKPSAQSRSTLPPLRMIPTFWPATATLPARAAARPMAPVGSTTSFMRSHRKRMASTISASDTVIMS